MTYQILSERKADTHIISGPGDAYNAFKRYAKAKTEWFFVASLNAAHEIIKVRVVSIGLISKCIIAPREVYVGAITDMAFAIIIGHNHPSGRHDNISQEDIDISNRLQTAGDLLGIPVLDSLVISRYGYSSLVEKGLLKHSR